MKSKIINIEVKDIRFPTSKNLDGSDAMNAISDYSATYVTLRTDANDDLVGNGLTFTIGRGNELCVQAVKSLAALFVQDRYLEDITANFGRYWHELVAGDCQLRWVGPEKGVIHLATAAIINAIWDLWAKKEGKPVWKLLADMSPEQLVNCVDFTYLTDVLTPEEAITMLRKVSTTKAQREEEMLRDGFPGYTTAAGWLGYSEEKMRTLARQAVADGWTHLKQKVGADIEQDIRRATILREELGWDYKLMMDANQIWDVDQAVENMRRLAAFDPWWIEEPTSPDDILGHAAIRQRIAPIGVATGEHAHNRVMFKQMFQAGSLDFCQLDPARLGGLNEVLAVLLLAAKFNIPVCPHGGGVGLCQYSQNIVLFDYIAVSASLDKRVLEYVDHLHENFIEPITINRGRYMPPKLPGYSVTMKEASLARFEYPHGEEWRD
ncbi:MULTISPECIES: enolase C-terminal domain-like protein [Yersinia]|uniref:enolase C-terminal domain-like protein n=1 Tax=Yersinia TaxID=629 RepID=UPI0005DCAF2E|nr:MULTISPECIES: enolase C-terminal domain-like protein [Yersinia]OVZ98184.1 fuconate dehydratase [Yersinia frederiksenii]RXA98118.1 fuconate dehydratase [Yersinia sp. 2105 StPb PI]CNH95563.1 mandelate racemase/muconate lactonizing enzyme family protein [Yersinia frederiksenii]CNI06742.1 mandelate racemase/muconate lactonizing enzyme family protein [Yersinia frederiksenii]CNK07890.1 mandelate racemase/muconate lactonizing enzyme family protein [Yersinia frederiksenii]